MRADTSQVEQFSKHPYLPSKNWKEAYGVTGFAALGHRRLSIILETAVRDDKVMQDFELESFLIGGDIP